MTTSARPLAGSSVLVAGASGGLGSRAARLLAERGALLTLVARREEPLRALDIGGAPAISPGDIGRTEDCDRAVQAALGAHGRLDGVLTCAGVVAFGPLEELTDDALAQLVATNLTGPLKLFRAALPHLPEGGFLANVSAITAELPTADMVAYSAVKAAAAGAADALHKELRRRKIGVIDLRPPHTDTGLDQRPIAGQAPPLPPGIDPDVVARRIVDAIEADEKEVPAAAFGR